MDKSREVFCEHCAHYWFTISEHKKITCPSCGLKTRNDLNGVKEKKKKRGEIKRRNWKKRYSRVKEL